MTAIVVDASAVAKLFINEENSAEAHAILLESSPVLAPDLLISELANLLWKRVRRGDITAAESRAALRRLPELVDLIPCHDLALAALNLALDLNHPAFNCFYLAVARDRGCDLVTADARLIAVASALDISVRPLTRQVN